MNLNRNHAARAATVTTAVLLAVLAACSADPDAGPEPTPSTSGTPSDTPTETVPPELVGFSEDERAAFVEASAAYDEFTAEGAKLEADPRATVEAKEFYQRYSTEWVQYFTALAQMSDGNIRVTGERDVMSETPTGVNLGTKRGDVVVLRRCVDSTAVVVMQGDKELEQPGLEVPRYSTVSMVKRPGETWWRAGAAEQGDPC